MFCPSRVTSILTFEANTDRKRWRFKLRRAKYRLFEAGLHMIIRCIPNITLWIGIIVIIIV